MKKDLRKQFEEEIRNFWTLALLNLVFAAITMAFGISFVVTRLLEMVQAGTPELLSVVIVAVGFFAAGLGLKWMLSSVQIFRGVKEIKSGYDALAGVTEETITGFIIRLTAQYREKRATIRMMILVCTIGGCCFLGLGILNGIQFLGGITSGTFTMNYLLVPSALLALGIGVVSLLNSIYFRRYSFIWDLRLQEAARTGEILEKTLEQDAS